MKILHCLNSPKIGGIERLVIDLAIEQRLQGINVVIMLDSFDGQYLKNIKKHNIKTIASGIKSGYDISLLKLINLYKQFKQFDIIHFHHFSSIKCAAAIFSKTVYTIHGLSKGSEKKIVLNFTSGNQLNIFL